MQVQEDSKPYDTINVTPMLDLAYVLLVIFIVMTTASVQGLKIDLPKPSNKPSTEKGNTGRTDSTRWHFVAERGSHFNGRVGVTIGRSHGQGSTNFYRDQRRPASLLRDGGEHHRHGRTFKYHQCRCCDFAYRVLRCRPLTKT